MAKKDVQIKLGFTADVGEAKRQLESLNSSIQKITLDHMNTNKLTESTHESIDAVLRLNTLLQNSKNNLGTLDLSKFIISLRNSGTSIDDYAKHFTALGNEGAIAFARISQVIRQANTPLIQAKGLVADFLDQMERTIKLQASYGVLNSFTSVFRNALNYAQDLNKNLTDIRIVTMKGADEMAKFARNANQAAKALSSSTDDFTKASLIYYQQGLSDQEVMERTTTTIKLANTSGESAEQISSYMTAIWNNFDDGTKSLEYYADALSYLGAVSAASNADIAEGLQSFAATASTVGLSYEYATSALTTLVDKTQQSASTIGNALKTIFARLNSVKLGETLEDGVDLTKYSSALAKVGVDVITANGNLKTMDTILDELAERWKTLGDAEKTALAQTVGGVRQYNNLISLMDNYDTMTLWASGAAGSTGYLNQQAEIYAESWEGAKNRVESALQGLYDTLVNDDFFIWLNNTFATLISSIDNVVESMGGIPNVLITIGTLFTTLAQDKILGGLDRIEQFFMPMTERGRAQIEKLRTDTEKAFHDILINISDPSDTINALFHTGPGEGGTSSLIEEYNNLYSSLSESQQKIVAGQIESVFQLAQQEISLSSQLDKAQQRLATLEEETTEYQAQKTVIIELNKEIQRTDLKLEEENKHVAEYMERAATAGPTAREAALGIAGALGQAAIAAHSVLGLVKTISNPNLSGWEKFISIVSMSVTAFGTLYKLHDKIQAGQLKTNALKLVELATEKAITKEKQEQIKAEKNKQYATLKEAGINNLQDLLNKQKELKAKQGSLNAPKGKGGKLSVLEHAILGINGKNSGLFDKDGNLINKLIGEEALSTITKMLPKLSLTAAIIAGIGFTAYAIYKNYKDNQPEEKLKKLSKELETVSSHTEELKNKVEEVSSTLDKLENNKSTFEELEEGTAAWTAALAENNQQVLELLKEYGLLAKFSDYVNQDKHGFMSLNSKGSEAIQNKANARYLDSMNMQLMAQVQAARLQEEVIQKNNIKNYKGDRVYQTTKYSAGVNQTVESLKDITNEIFEAASKAYLNGQLKLVQDGDDYIFESLTDSVDGLTDENLNLLNKNAELMNAVIDNTTAIREQQIGEEQNKIQVGRNLLGESGLTDETYQAAYDQFEEERAPLVDYYTKMYSNGGFSVKEKEEITQLLKDTLGYLDISNLKYDSANGYITYNYTDANGELQTDGKENGYTLATKDAKQNFTFKGTKQKASESELRISAEELNELTEGYEELSKAQKEVVDTYEDYLKVTKDADAITAKIISYDYGNAVDGWADLIDHAKEYFNLMSKGKNGDSIDAMRKMAKDLSKTSGIESFASLGDEKLWEFQTKNAKLIQDAISGSVTAQNELNNKIYDATLLSNQYYAANEEFVKAAMKEADDFGAELAKAGLEAGDVVSKDLEKTADEVMERGLELAIKLRWTEAQFHDYLQKQRYEININAAFRDAVSGELLDYRKVLAAKAAGTLDISTREADYTYMGNNKIAYDAGKNNAKSSSSSSSKEKKELERYYHIKKVLEDLKDILEDLSVEEERAFGKNRIKAMAEQVAYYEKMLEAQQKYYDAVTSNLAAEESQLASMGLSFDEHGIPTNAEQWYYDNSLDENAMKVWEKWEEDYGLKMDLENQMRDARNNIYDKKLNIITYRAEFQIEMDEFSLKVLEYLKEQLDDPAYETAEGIKNLSLQMERYNHEYEVYKKELLDILDFASGGRGLEYLTRLMNGEDIESIADSLDLTDEARKELFDAAEKMMSSASSMKQVWESLLASIDEFFESWQEKFEDLIADVQHLVNISSKLKDIVNLIGKDRLGVDNATMRRFDETASAAAISTYNIRAMAERAAQEAYDAAVANGWDQDPNMSEQWEGIRKRLQEAKENTVQATYDMAQAFQNQFENAMNIVIEEWEDAIAGIYKNLESLQGAFDRAKKLDDNYLDTYDQAYRIEKLLRNIDKAVNDSDILKNRQALANLYDEINGKQEAGIELSQYQVDAYQKEYELLLALQALQDAQNAKSLVRMRRDSEGNMGYVYTADQNSINDAENNYNDVAYAYAQLNEGRVGDLQNAFLSLWNEYSDAISKAAAEHRQLTDEEMNYFTEQFAYITSQMEEAFNYNSRLIGLTSLDYWDLTKNFDQTILSHVTGYQTLTDLATSYERAISNSIVSIRNAVVTYNNQIEDNVYINTESINRYLDSTQEELTKTDEKVVELGDEYENELSKMVDETEVFRNTWEAAMESVIQEAGEVASALSVLGQVYSAQTAAADGLTDANYRLADSYRALAAAQTAADYKPTTTQEPKQKYQLIDYISNNVIGTYNSKAEAEAANTKRIDGAVRGYVKAVSGDTGMYTGEWGGDTGLYKNGKLAILHEKELVLNKDDTENFLDVVNTVRDLDLSKVLQLNDYTANANLNMANINRSGEFLQNVTINADFPNATDRNEIGLAFNDLLNRASQLMNQK